MGTRFTWTSAAARRLRMLAGMSGAPMGKVVERVVEQALGGELGVPTDLPKLASRFHVVEIVAEDLFYSGELRKVPGGFKIAYSKHQSSVRSRFTIAHEIAHAIFESSGKHCPRFGRELERLCDMLAAEIVMPRRVFASQIQEVGISCAGILQLARRFRTSISSTAIRYAQVLENDRRLRLSTFEVKGDQVSWGYGLVRRGPLVHVDRAIRAALRESDAKPSASSVIWLSTPPSVGDWTVEWERLGNSDRTLVLLAPTRDLATVRHPPKS